MPDAETVGAFLGARHLELAAGVGEFAARRIAPLPPAATDLEARSRARELLDLLGREGWARHAVADSPQAKPDLRACCLIREVLAGVSPLADAVFALQALGSLPLATAGGEVLKGRWLPEIAAGRVMTAFALTEPGAGSDVGALRTRARRDGTDWVLEGAKTYISNAGVADLYTVFARSGRDGGGTDGISAFVIPAETPGLVFAGAQVLSEPHPLGELRFEGCRVPASHLLGEEGGGFKLAMRTLDRLRATVAAAACGMAGRALSEALTWSRDRHQFGRPLADFQLTRQKLARMATDLAAARLLTYRAAAAADRGVERVTLESAMAKAFATEAAQRIVDDAVQLLGGRGVLAETPVDRLYRSVRALRIYEGATEIQHLVIARELLAREDADRPAGG